MSLAVGSVLGIAVVAALPSGGSSTMGDTCVLAGDGHLYTYNGAAWVDNGAAGGGGGGGPSGSVTLDFGTGGGFADVTIAHPAAATTDLVIAALAGSTADHSADEHALEDIDLRVAVYPGEGYAIFGNVRQGTTHGAFNVNWAVV